MNGKYVKISNVWWEKKHFLEPHKIYLDKLLIILNNNYINDRIYIQASLE
jgi:hypothetical protein